MLEINLQLLRENYQILQKQVGESCMVAGVVKANAYGLGIEPIARTLLELGCPFFFTATLKEAVSLRKIIKETPIAVLNGILPGQTNIFRQNNLLPVLNSPDMLKIWQETAIKEKKTLPTILHFDTGMNRLGFSELEAEAFIHEQNQAFDHLDVQWIMTHFACADEKDHPLTSAQAERFFNIAKHFPNAKKSLGNSPGVFRSTDYHIDMVRPGFALYGGNPHPEKENVMKNIVTLHVPVLQTRLCRKGESIGYGASHIFEKDTMTATISIGYADGFLRSASNQAKVYYQGTTCPVLGRVSMDLTTIDISHLNQPPQAGDMIEILGPHQTVDDLADNASTIGYEILTSLGQRYERKYIS
ncbi:MAG: alanine racemase [Pseudomonadota bacterium]